MSRKSKARRLKRMRVRSLRFTCPAGIIRQTLINAQGRLCGICGERMTCRQATIDHVRPKGRGGPDRFGNIVAAHAVCNERKSGRKPHGCELIWLDAVNARLGFGEIVGGHAACLQLAMVRAA